MYNCIFISQKETLHSNKINYWILLSIIEIHLKTCFMWNQEITICAMFAHPLPPSWESCVHFPCAAGGDVHFCEAFVLLECSFNKEPRWGSLAVFEVVIKICFIFRPVTLFTTYAFHGAVRKLKQVLDFCLMLYLHWYFSLI